MEHKESKAKLGEVTIKNMGDLTKVLIDEINLLRKGEVTPSRCNAMANLTGKVMQGVKLAIEADRYVSRMDKRGSEIPLIELSQREKKVVEQMQGSVGV